MPARNIALLGQEAAVGRNLPSRPLKGAPCHVQTNLPTRIREVRDSPVIQRIMAIGQLLELIHTIERKLSRKHCMISSLLLLWDVSHKSERRLTSSVSAYKFCRKYSLASMRI